MSGTTEQTALNDQEKKKGLYGSFKDFGKKAANTASSAVHSVGGGVASVVGGGASKLSAGYGKAFGTYDKIFLKDKNREFGDHLEVASRGAVFVVICAIPFVAPGEICSFCDDIVRQKIYTSVCVTYFIYTLYTYAGDIIHFAQGGVTGTILAVFNIWLLQGFMPGGYTESMPHRWWLGNAWGIAFVFIMLWLNFDDLTRIFGLSTFVWYWMVFITPDATAGFSQNFEIRLGGQAMRELMVACIGCGLALIAAFVPYPIYAHDKAVVVSKNLLSNMFNTKSDFVSYYGGDKCDNMRVKILRREMETLQSERDSISALLDSAWYECLGKGTWRVQHDMMAAFADFIAKSLDLMSNCLEICKYETFDVKHVKLMTAINEPLRGIVTGNGEVLEACIAGLDDVGFDAETKNKMEQKKGEVKVQLEKMTKALQEARSQNDLNKVVDDITGENVVALTFAKYTHLTADFYDTLRDLTEKKEKGENETSKGLLSSLTIFDPNVIFEKDHLMWTLRNGASIIIAFYAGWHGYNQYIAAYNAAIASTVCVLLSKFVGSAMVKNLARLQGVVIGIVLGNLLYAFLGWCYWWGHLLVALALYFWTLLGLFMYFHSTNYSTVGLLLVVFGTQSLLRPCANTDTDPAGHAAIVNVTVAIVIMTVVDIFLSPARASDLSLDLFRQAHTGVRDALDKLLDAKVEGIENRGVALGAAIAKAKSMGVEAGLEPRYYRHDWPTSKYDQAISCLETMSFCINSIETIVLKPMEGTLRPKKKVFLDALKLSAFETKVKDVLLLYTKRVMELVEADIGEKPPNRDVFESRLGVIEGLESGEKTLMMEAHENYGSVDAMMKDLQDALDDDKFKQQSDETKTDVSKDPLADLSLVVESLRAIFVSLDATFGTLVT